MSYFFLDVYERLSHLNIFESLNIKGKETGLIPPTVLLVGGLLPDQL